ncbi:MAG: LLM class F420-dependent oxidoreductase, partial [Ilumatobacteraceae bacterium]
MPFHRHPPIPALTSGDALMTLAERAEAAGFGAVALTEHPAPDAGWLATGGHHAYDPFVGLAFAAARTTTVRLLTYLTVLPYRNPLLLAKTVASLDVLSGGRLTLGVGTGYLEPEFRALGVDFATRNARFDETLDVCDAAWRGEPVSVDGSDFQADANVSLPRPLQNPRPPIWIGGNSSLSRRRVVERAEGWMPLNNRREFVARRRTMALETLEDLAGMLDGMRKHAASIGRPTDFDVMYPVSAPEEGELDEHRELLAGLADLGVSWVL